MAVTYPNESPEYRAARNALIEAELELRARTEAVAALRRDLPEGGEVPQDYAFTTLDGGTVRMSSLFGDHDTLVLYSLMYGKDATNPCPLCTSMLEGLNGQMRGIGANVALAIVAEAAPDTLAAFAGKYHLDNLRLLSCGGTSYQSDYNAATPDGAQLPILNVFRRSGDRMTHFWGSELFFAKVDGHARHIDTIWPLWNMLDFTPQGRGAYMPSLSP